MCLTPGTPARCTPTAPRPTARSRTRAALRRSPRSALETLLAARAVGACIPALPVIAERTVAGVTVGLFAVAALWLPLNLLRARTCSVLLIEIRLGAPALSGQIALIPICRARARLASVGCSVLLV